MPWAATLDHHCAGARKGLLSSFFALLALACEPVKRHSGRRCFLKDPAFVLLSSWPTLRHHHLPLATCHLPLVLVMCAIFQEQLPLVGGLLECCHISICFVDRREGYGYTPTFLKIPLLGQKIGKANCTNLNVFHKYNKNTQNSHYSPAPHIKTQTVV